LELLSSSRPLILGRSGADQQLGELHPLLRHERPVQIHVPTRLQRLSRRLSLATRRRAIGITVDCYVSSSTCEDIHTDGRTA